MIAGSAAALAISRYGILSHSDITKAAAPMTGGISWPLPPAAVSIPPATSGLNPTRFISGIVIEPMVAVLAIEEPVIAPRKAEAPAATVGGPARVPPKREKATRIRYSPAPVRSRIAPKRTKAEKKG